MINKWFLLFIAVLASCGPDYGMYINKVEEVSNTEPEVIVITETITEVIVVPEYVEVEVEVEVEVDNGEIWVDSFTQINSVNGVDIIWVIDTSGSMNTYNTQLYAGIDAMLNALPPTGWRLAMVAADGNRSEHEAQFPLLPGDTVQDAQNMHQNMLTGHLEQGFDAIYRFMMFNTYAQSWLRPDAALLVVFVSDEEDQSTNFHQVQDFVNWYGSLRNGSAYVSSVVNFSNATTMCSWNVSPLHVGDRYMDATNQFSGQIVDICDPDWSAGVVDAAVQIAPYDSIELTHTPSVEDSIRVFFDGQLNWDWTYDSGTNTIYFTTEPDAGVLVEVGYLYHPSSPTQPSDTGTTDTGDTGA
jgi:hypothetical protein